MSDKEWSPGNILDVFGDPVARATLVLASEQPVTVQDLADQLDVSDPTVYRRIDPLVEANLLSKHTQIDERGNQPNEYETVLDEVTFSVDTDGYTVDIQVRQDLADDFESLWSDLESTGQNPNAPHRTRLLQSDERGPDVS